MIIKLLTEHHLEFLSLKEAAEARPSQHLSKGSLTVWALYAYFSDSQNAAFELLVWCM